MRMSTLKTSLLMRVSISQKPSNLSKLISRKSSQASKLLFRRLLQNRPKTQPSPLLPTTTMMTTKSQCQSQARSPPSRLLLSSLLDTHVQMNSTRLIATLHSPIAVRKLPAFAPMNLRPSGSETLQFVQSFSEVLAWP